MTQNIKHFSIGFNFKDKPLNTNQGNKAAEGLRKTLEFLPNLEVLTVWGYPISTTMETLSKCKHKISTCKIIAGCNRTYMFDRKPGELHCLPGTFEYRNTSLLYKFTVEGGFYLFDESGTPIQKPKSTNHKTHLELRSYSIMHIVGLKTIKCFNDNANNSLTKVKATSPSIVVPKNLISNMFIDHKKSLSNQIPYIKEVGGDVGRLFCDVNNWSKFEFMKCYMHKFNWEDLTISVDLNKSSWTYLLGFLVKQTGLKYLRLVIRSPEILAMFLRKVHGIVATHRFELVIVDLMVDDEETKDADMQDDKKSDDEDMKVDEDEDEVKSDKKEAKPDKEVAQSDKKDKKSESKDIKEDKKTESKDIKEDEKTEKEQEKKSDKTQISDPDKKSSENESASDKNAQNAEKSMETETAVSAAPKELSQDKAKDIKTVNPYEGKKIVHWWSEWCKENPQWHKYLKWRTRIIIDQDIKIPTVTRPRKIRTYCEEDA